MPAAAVPQPLKYSSKSDYYEVLATFQPELPQAATIQLVSAATFTNSPPTGDPATATN